MFLSLLTVLFIVTTPDWAQAQNADLEISVRDSTFDEDGTTRLIVNVTGSARPDVVDPAAFTVTENGEEVAVTDVEPLLEEGGQEVVVMLVLDTSTSMAGEPLQAIKEAAQLAVDVLIDQGILVGLVEFNTDTVFHSGPTEDAQALRDAIDGMEATGRTALYDAVADAADVVADADIQGNLLVFADGEDNESDRSGEEAIGSALGAEAPVNIVVFETDVLDLDVLRPLAEETGGRMVTAAETDAIGEVFAGAVADIASQYVLTYESMMIEPDTLDVRIAVEVEAFDAEAGFSAPNPRQQQAAAPAPEVTRRPAGEPGLLGSPGAIYLGISAAFAALLLLLGLMFTGQRTTADRVLAGQLERYIERGDRRAGRSGLVATHFRERAMELLEATPKPKGFDENLTLRLEQAAWPLRNGEFILLAVGSALTAGTVAGLLANLLGGLLVALVAGATPWLVLEVRRSRRQDAFLRNLPDTLQLIAGSLRAGYGVTQALDSVAKEATGPASEEFQRVITEARLGIPVEEALEAMAQRIDNDDFRWVVLAINIQREVGGNLAELLDTVAETLREREMLRRQIKVLSAEGRLSAVILVALPFVLVLYLILIRPEYIGTLVTSGLYGWAMVVGAGTLMLIGIVWIRRMIQIEV